jgi:cytochrome c biogenesis protein ResB
MKTSVIESMPVYTAAAEGALLFAVYFQKIISYLYFSLILCIILIGRMLRLKPQKRRLK